MTGLHPRKIVFINPPYERIAPGYAFVRHITNRSPSLGLLHLAAQVREHGYEPSIIESDILDLDAEAVADRVIAARPAYVGITLFTVGVFQSVKIARRIKAHLPHCPGPSWKNLEGEEVSSGSVAAAIAAVHARGMAAGLFADVALADADYRTDGSGARLSSGLFEGNGAAPACTTPGSRCTDGQYTSTP